MGCDGEWLLMNRIEVETDDGGGMLNCGPKQSIPTHHIETNRNRDEEVGLGYSIG